MNKPTLPKITIFIFMLVLWLPLLSSFLGLSDIFSLNENRVKANAPSLLSVLQNTGSFEKYYQDNFGLRSLLIGVNDVWQLKVLKSSTSDSVLIGKDNWLFYAPDTNYLYTINAMPLSNSALWQISTNLKQINNYFTKRGIHFYFLVAPNKQSIYPEELPGNVQLLRPNSQLDQITTYLSKNAPEIHFLNPVPELRSNKKYQLYYKYDTHWDFLGAYFAYQQLIQTIHTDLPEISPLALKDLTLTTVPSNQKDLEIMLGVKNYYRENTPWLTVKNPQSRLISPPCENPYEQCSKQETVVSNPELPKMVMYRDSFATLLIPLLSQHFQKAVYLWSATPWQTDIVDKEHPQIVVVEITERELWRLSDHLFTFQN